MGHNFPESIRWQDNELWLLDQTRLLYQDAWDAMMEQAASDKSQGLTSALETLFEEIGQFNTQAALFNCCKGKLNGTRIS